MMTGRALVNVSDLYRSIRQALTGVDQVEHYLLQQLLV